MHKIFRLISDNLLVAIFIYIAIQFIILIFIPFLYKSDSLYNYNLAQQCIASHSFYPMPQHLYQDYIIAPLYINLIIIVLSVYNSTFSIGLLNIFLNILQLYLVFLLSRRIFNNHAARISVILYIFYISSIGLILMNLTELSFGCLILGSIYFYLLKNKVSYYISGLLAAASVGIRPLGWSLIVIYFAITIYQLFSKRSKKPLFIIAGLISFLLVFGSLTYLTFGKFIFTSNNGPINILIGANKNATGAFNASVFDKGNSGFIDSSETKTFYLKENYWKNQAENWILKHPIKWISLFPLKIFYMFAWDDFSVSHLFDYGKWNLFLVLKTIFINGNFGNILSGMPFYEKIIYIIVQILHHLYYFSLLTIFLFLLFRKNKSIFFNEGILISLSFISICLLMNLATYGDARYKYPYIILIIIMISDFVYKSLIVENINKNSTVEKND